jgi:hypothetical protein
MGADYAEGLMTFAHWWMFWVVILSTIIIGYIGIRLAITWMKDTGLK